MNSTENFNHYIPGTCNIGPKEISVRKKASILAAIVCVISMVLILILHTHKSWRLMLFIPATACAVTFQQWYFKFCVAFGIKGIFNFGDLGKSFSIQQKAHYRKDRMKAIKMIIVGMLFGLIISVLFYFLP
ncbi:MAG: hypothetical protein ACO3EE_00985 [Flavobacteriales bacterium]